MEFIRFIRQNGATDLSDAVLKYTLSQAKTEHPERLAKILNTGLVEGNTMGTFVDYVIDQNKGTWVESGVQKGIQKGVQIGVQKGVQIGESGLLIYLLKRKFELKKIPEQYREQIEKANPKKLMKWAGKVLESQSLEETFVD